MSDLNSKLPRVDQEIVKMLLDTKAINFEALGKVIATIGPSVVAMDDDGWIRMCGSDLHVYRWPRPHVGLEDLVVLRDLVRELPQRRG